MIILVYTPTCMIIQQENSSFYPIKWNGLHGSNDIVTFYYILYFYPIY
jgi:hypothetical protein